MARLHNTTAYKVILLQFCLLITTVFLLAQQNTDARLSVPDSGSPIFESTMRAIDFLRRGNPAEAYSTIETLLNEPTPAPEILALGAFALARDARGPRALRFAELLTATPGYRLPGLAVLFDVQSKTFSPTLAINTVASRLGSTDSATWTRLGETYAEILTDFGAKSAPEVIEQSLPIFVHAAAVSMEESPENIVKTHLRLADLYATQNDPAAVTEALRRALDADPENRDALIRLAVALIESGDMTAATSELEKIVRQDPTYLPALTALIELYITQERNDEARTLIELAIAQPGFDNEITLATVALRIRAWSLADQLAQKALAKDDTNLDAYSILIDAALRENRNEDALLHASEAYSRFPNSALVCQMAVVAAREANRPDLAELFLERLERINPGDPQGLKPQILLIERAILAERRNDLDEMEQLFRQVLQLDPDNHFAMNYMAYTWADRGINLQEALTLITQALTFEPENSAYLDTIGWVHYQLGDFPKAYEFISRALEIGPPHEEILENLGDAAHALGRKDEALRHWQESLRLQPDRPFVQEKIDALQRGETLTHPLPYRPLPGQPPLTTTPRNPQQQPQPTDPNPHQNTDADPDQPPATAPREAPPQPNDNDLDQLLEEA